MLLIPMSPGNSQNGSLNMDEICEGGRDRLQKLGREINSNPRDHLEPIIGLGLKTNFGPNNPNQLNIRITPKDIEYLAKCQSNPTEDLKGNQLEYEQSLKIKTKC
ncbi:unnamed protein product [Microthlaspi erraticum]|uniref:Uncharacterized protein n=1 Tax=Microthlaspi erraticum TaxID=1685480 RepID=A0A6D2IK89_9BRAS|nr:unnamed protein product [Microthlaspi erraticum]